MQILDHPATPVPQESPREQGVWSESAVRVLRERYLLKDDQGNVIETPDEMCWRVAKAVAIAEVAYSDNPKVGSIAAAFYRMMVSHDFLPNSPTLMNAGKGNGLQLSACYVLPVEDSIDGESGIFNAIRNAAVVHKSGGGTGFSFSRLRQKGARVGSTNGVASGPVSFMRVFDAATEQIKQGSNRRGANMGILRVDHPDILEFIDCKRSGGITNFNISVAITDPFMLAYLQDAEYDLLDPQDLSRPVGKLRARDVMDRIVDAAWSTGDPGLFFIDRCNNSRANPTPELEQIEATNPCGEQGLPGYDACNLGSINLGNFVTWDEILERYDVDWKRLEEVTRLATRFLDNVIDINPYPLPEIRQKVLANRRIGLGVMGWADLLIGLGIRYDSKQALDLGVLVMQSIQEWSEDASANLAEERAPFPNFPVSIYREGRPLRNATRTTVAPTGSISILADCSSGIEPLFALAFQHKVKQPDGEYRVLDFFNQPLNERIFDLFPLGVGDRARHRVVDWVKEHGSLHGFEESDDGFALDGEFAELKTFVTAHEIEPEWHIRMQAAFQEGVDNAISKTVNMPNSATREDVAVAYHLAWELGCVGVTIFRDGCKGEQVLNLGVTEAPKAIEAPEQPVAWTGVKQRPSIIYGRTQQIRAPEGVVNITLNSDEDGPFEAFINVGKAGSDIAGLAEALGRLISLHLRTSGPVPPIRRAQEIVDQLRGIGGSRTIGFGTQRVRSLPDAVAQALESYIDAETEGFVGHATPESVIRYFEVDHATPSGNQCADCGNYTMVFEEGCNKCKSCGHSSC